MNKGEVSIKYCLTEYMLADYFTKPLQGKMFRDFRRVIMGYETISWLKNRLMQPKERVGKDVKRIACKNINENSCKNNQKNSQVKFKGVNETSEKKMTYAGILTAGNRNKGEGKSIADLIKLK